MVPRLQSYFLAVLAVAALPQTLCGRNHGPAASACFSRCSAAGSRRGAEHGSPTSWGRAYRASLHPSASGLAPLPNGG